MTEIIIQDLRGKIEAKEVTKPLNKESQTIETQTESEFQDIHCKDCVYVASCMEELDFHLENDHGQDEPEESGEHSIFSCNICGEKKTKTGPN